MDVTVPRKLTNTSTPNGPPQEVKLYYFAAAATAGDGIVLDRATTTYGLGSAAKKVAASVSQSNEPVGILRDTVAAGNWAAVVTYGVISSPNIASGSAGQDVAIGDGATAGRLSQSSTSKIGTLLEDVAANTARVFVSPAR